MIKIQFNSSYYLVCNCNLIGSSVIKVDQVSRNSFSRRTNRPKTDLLEIETKFTEIEIHSLLTTNSYLPTRAKRV